MHIGDVSPEWLASHLEQESTLCQVPKFMSYLDFDLHVHAGIDLVRSNKLRASVNLELNFIYFLTLKLSAIVSAPLHHSLESDTGEGKK